MKKDVTINYFVCFTQVNAKGQFVFRDTVVKSDNYIVGPEDIMALRHTLARKTGTDIKSCCIINFFELKDPRTLQ
ncbi:MAG: hypothetical protein GY909_15310 [Oligoflexia bacterium]|nr:hypothetical protein [Oligoflexia bacterium]